MWLLKVTWWHTRTSHESEVVSSPYFVQCVNPNSPKNTRGELSYLGFVASEAPHWRRPQSSWRPAGPEKMAGLDTKEWAFFEPTKSWLANINSGLKTNKNLWFWPGKGGLPEDCHSGVRCVSPRKLSGWTAGFPCAATKIHPWQAMILSLWGFLQESNVAMEFLRYSEGGYEWENHLHIAAISM